jgi:hypothetical protein
MVIIANEITSGQTPLLHWVKTSSADFLSEKFERKYSNAISSLN